MDDSPEDAWLKGDRAGHEGQALATNPYPAGSELALDWADGWLHGERLGGGPELLALWASWAASASP